MPTMKNQVRREKSNEQNGSENIPVECRFVRTVVEDLDELRSSQVEHELRVESEVLLNPETLRIVFRIFAKLLTLFKQQQQMYC